MANVCFDSNINIFSIIMLTKKSEMKQKSIYFCDEALKTLALLKIRMCFQLMKIRKIIFLLERNFIEKNAFGTTIIDCHSNVHDKFHFSLM